MRVGIVTLYYPYRCDNYGGTLQNYALSQVIRRYKYTPQTLCFVKCANRLHIIESVRLFLYHQFGIEIYNKRPRSIGIQKKRNDSFRRFERKYLDVKRVWAVNDKSYLKLNRYYSTFVVGSDQVWNPDWALTEFTKYPYFLQFADKSKRNTYAVSFGVDSIPESQYDFMSSAIGSFDKLSVRENEGRRIIEDLAGKEAQVVLDPTLLLSKQDWNNVICDVDVSQVTKGKKYVLTYFLGDLKQEDRDYIYSFADKNEFSIISMADESDETLYAMGPAEFLRLISEAQAVFTDSFHATVFSFIFDKPFIVFERKQHGMRNMNSRIETLLRLLDLNNRKIESVSPDNLLEADYTLAKQRLSAEIDKSLDYLYDIMPKV